MERIVVTGADGIAGSLIRPLLRERYELTLFTREQVPLQDGERGAVGDIQDGEAVAEAVRGADAIVHLAGVSTEGDFASMIDVNIRGTHNVLEAARRHGVRRVLIASSAHAVGGVAIEDATTVGPDHMSPTSFYGASKVAVEALARVHAERYRMSVVIARIGTVLAQPRTKRQLATWLSPADMVRLVDTTVALTRVGAWTVWAVSRNERRWVSLHDGRAIGYVPKDDSEAFAPALLADHADTSLSWATLGGPWGGPDPDHRWPGEPEH